MLESLHDGKGAERMGQESLWKGLPESHSQSVVCNHKDLKLEKTEA